jgi:hypothetical protein
MDLFDTLTFAEILGRTTFLGTLSLTILKGHLDLFLKSSFYKEVLKKTYYSIESSQSLKARKYSSSGNPNGRLKK